MIKHGFAFRGEHMIESEDESLPIVVNIGNFRYDGGFRFESTRIQRYTGPFPEDYVLAPGTLLLVMTCQTPGGEILGIPGRIPGDGARYLHNQRLGRVIVTRPDELDEGYLYYLFLSRPFNSHLAGSASGSKILHTSPDRIVSFQWERPAIGTQRRIAAVLAAYDAAMAVNERRILLLEELARLLYRKRMIPSRLGDKPEMVLPTGWCTEPVERVFETSGGGTPPRSKPQYWDGGTINWYSPTDLTRGGTMFAECSSDRITPTGLSESSAKLFPAYSVMMTSRATIGVVAINTTPACTNQGFINCIPNDRVPKYFLYHWLVENVPLFIRQATGSTFKEITRGVFRRIEFYRPPDNVVQRFEQAVTPFHETRLNLERRNRALRAARDLLLPKLLSEQLSIDHIPDPPAMAP